MEKAIITDILLKLENLIDIFHYPEKYLLEKYNLEYTLEELEVEYVSLFVANYDITPLSLYLASYVNASPNNLLEKLNSIYKSANVQLARDFNNRADHITVILEFFYLLIESGINERYFRIFFKNYIYPFNKLPEFIKKRTINQFYLLGAKKLEKLCHTF